MGRFLIFFFVRLTAGVRQGGILSPFLFIVYVDDLLNAFESSKLGCRIKGFYVGVFMYADDIILLSPSVTVLQQMINLCFCELSNVDLCINFRKSMCLRIGRKFNEFCVQLHVCHNSLIWAKQIRYLGLYFISGRILKVDFNVAKRKFFISCNSLFSKISSHKADLILPLVSSFGIPVLLYGLESVKLNKSELSRLSHPYTMVFHKIFGTYSKTIISQCQFYTGNLPLDYLYKFRLLCFLKNLPNLSNNTIDFLYKLFGYDLFLSTALEFGIDENDNRNIMKDKLWFKFSSAIEF